MTTGTVHTKPLVVMEGISKNFHGFYALKNVDFNLSEGEVHVLFGENGAGKSTLMAILAGVHRPTTGTIKVSEQEVAFHSVHDSKHSGIGTVFQEFSLVPTLTVAENIFLGDEPLKNGFLDKTRCLKEAEGYFKRLDFDIDIRKKVSELSRAEQQMVEIVKAIKADAKVLILDEPTASLTDKEVAKLFEFVHGAKKKGVGIIYISHRIQEFREIADRITVLRDGELIGTFNLNEVSDEDLIESMAGRAIAEIYPPIIKQETNTPLLLLKEFQAEGLQPITLEVKSGEVLGIAGLVGSGKSRLWRSIMGLYPATSGTVLKDETDLFRKATKVLVKNGIFYLPPDRKEEGLQLLAKTENNIKTNVLFRKDILSKFGLVNTARQQSITKQASQKSDLKSRYLKQSAADLSGGNQQKILFAKGLVSQYDIYILDEPSVGVDVGTRSGIYLLIKELTEAGKAVVVISSDLPEVINLSHRVLVFSKGHITAELEGDQITENNILSNFF
ncbi:sugar ABC transporter ATP-binding protein [Muricauda ruestringensis]|uniref:Sugar ABC transporter ATP-binding protein n=1 Tax=Flagellimonas aurea TaxID=2915619 RepID=A0ABS3G9E2_9FLAO|nr:sugar ABC transporter ATP-binding protein [Allomuricauda aurea]MBO0356044.1 sugar ABC transporter ATP-binding protein [Allomuricauda aurea]